MTEDQLALFTAIAREHLSIKTLLPRGLDQHDFHEVSVWQVRRALEAAYNAGKKAGRI